jgi:RNA polymerase sigma factor (sigma-70 family)
MDDDRELLRQFADQGSQAAFAALVQRKIALVYAAARRQTGGDAHLAQDVTQGVFLALAAQARTLHRHTVLTGWLYTATRLVASNAVRTQQRWQRREQEANAMNELTRDADPAWEQLRPVLDEAMHELKPSEREVLLCRFFEGRSLADIGAALGVAENAARMRVERALEKLRGRLARRGIASTAAALGATLAAQPVEAVPAALAANAAAASLAGVALGGTVTAGLASSLVFMGVTKIAATTAVLVGVAALGVYVGSRFPHSAPHESAFYSPVTVAAPAPAASPSAPGASPASLRTVSPARPVGAPSASASLDSLRVLMDLQRRKLVAPDLKLVGDDGVTPEFAELFGLAPAERDALQRSLLDAGERLKALERQNTSVGRTPAGDVTIQVRPFPEAGGKVYDAMLKTFAETLGPERYQAFVALGSEQTEKQLERFGTPQRQIVYSRETTPAGEIYYRIHDRQNRAPGENANYSSDLLTPERFRQEIGRMAEVLPADFVAAPGK